MKVETNVKAGQAGEEPPFEDPSVRVRIPIN